MVSTSDHVHEYNLVEVMRERLLGTIELSINADCRGHDFDRPRQLPHTKPILHHTTDRRSLVWEKCEEGLGTLVVQLSSVRRLYDIF